MPGTSSYEYDDLINHVADFGLTDIGMILNNPLGLFYEDGGDTIITKDNFAKDYVTRIYVDTRKMALDAIKEGITLNGLSII